MSQRRDTYRPECDPFGYGMKCACDCGCDHDFEFGDEFAEQLLGVHQDGTPIVQAVCLLCGEERLMGDWVSTREKE